MSESDPVRPQQASSLRDRVASVFRPWSPQRRSPSPTPASVSQERRGRNTGSSPPGEITPRTRLLESYERCEPACGSRPCTHGTFSPRPGSSAGRELSISPVRKNGTGGFADSPGEGSSMNTSDRDDAVPPPLGLPPRATTNQLAKKHGVNRRNMCVFGSDPLAGCPSILSSC